MRETTARTSWPEGAGGGVGLCGDRQPATARRPEIRHARAGALHLVTAWLLPLRILTSLKRRDRDRGYVTAPRRRAQARKKLAARLAMQRRPPPRRCWTQAPVRIHLAASGPRCGARWPRESAP